MSKRRAEGLCYFCDEKFTPEHYLTYKKTQLFMIETEEDVEEEGNDDSQIIEREEECDVAQISVQAMTGTTGYRTMCVKGVHGKRILFILIDSGSTHNFVDPKIAAKLGCTLTPAGITRVAVADGRKLGLTSKVETFQWRFGGTDFMDEVMVLPLGNCDMVLGVQGLATFGPITWDFQKLEMQFK